MDKNDYNIALIIDADNISYKYLDTLIDELKGYGRIAYRRIYGDFTDPSKAGWASVIKENGIIPMQEYACIKGKNTTDIAMVIDAMDILYQKYVDCFCIATSDSDFTRLISRLKENNIFVIGAGESKANKAFIKNYDRFIILDQLYSVDEKERKKERQNNNRPPVKQAEAAKKEEQKPVEKPEETASDNNGEILPPRELIFDFVKDLLEREDGDEGWVYLSVVMQKIYAQYPEFNVKLYKAKNTREFFRIGNRFEIKNVKQSLMIRNKPSFEKKPN